MNYLTSNEWDLSERKSSCYKENFNRHKKTICVNQKIKWNTTETQGIAEQKRFIAKQTSKNKFLSFILLHALLIICILKESNSSIVEDVLPISIPMNRKITYRVLTTANPSNTEEFTKSGKSSVWKKFDWESGLPEDVVKTCMEFLNMKEELKDQIFLNDEDLNAFLEKMKEKKKTVATYAPQLLNENDNVDISNVKILNYWTHHVDTFSKINKLYNTLEDYEILFNHFMLKMWNIRDGIIFLKNDEFFNNFQKIVREHDLHGYIAMLERLNHIRDYLDKWPKDHQKKYDSEMKIIEKTKTLCYRYKKILHNMERYNNYRHSQQLFDLHYIEQIMKKDMPSFYELHKWM